jgi:hypothetical protein
MTNSPLTNNYSIPKDGYVAFDALSLRQLIINRLNEQGIFTDQNYIGSNLASIIDIISYSYNTLIYYLNKTATESMFTEAQLLENINRIVKIIDYSPIGDQTATLSFSCSANTFSQGFYTIPRYSYILINNIPFSFNEDIVFAKTQNTITESLDELAQQKLLFQGIFNEYPVYTATGTSNEMLLLDIRNEIVDHFNINVYVKPFQTGIWKQYTKTTNLYLEDGFSEKFELRLNNNNRYEIKFGNNINGKQLQPGDQVAVYYLVSKGQDGEVGANTINNTSLLLFTSIQYNQILNDINLNNNRYIDAAETTYFIFNNSSASTTFQNKETPDEIRQNAPSTYKSQYRLVTLSDYVTFIKTNFAYLFSDIKAVNNTDYVSGYLKYFYDIGLTTPTNTERALFNQVLYSDSCNFNNVYLIVVPKTETQDYLLPAQKELINTTIAQVKMTTTETTFLDPCYKNVIFGVKTDLTTPLTIAEDSFGVIVVTKQGNSRRDDRAIASDIANVFKKYFNKQNLKLGQTLNLRTLTQEILDIEGVESFVTANENDFNDFVQGLSLFVWNPLYPENDKQVIQNSITMKYFEIPSFFDIDNIESRIFINSSINPTTSLQY